MARTIVEWQQLIIDQLAENNITVSGSRTSIRRLWTFVVAVCSWTLDNLFDLHKSEVSEIIVQQKPHSKVWYRNKALAFQFGYPLVFESDLYDNTGLTEEEINASRIIKYSAVTEVETDSRLIVKIATEIDGVLRPLTVQQRNSFAAYMAEVKDAGVQMNIVNYLPDLLYLTASIYYNPLVLDANGESLLDGTKPVELAIIEYMKALPFNGQLVLAHLVDKLQRVPGVNIPTIANAESSWIDAATNQYGDPETIVVKKIPESGYFEVVSFNNITYLADV